IATNGIAAAAAAVEPRRNEPELLAVPMDESQELVFGWMGLNPALLAEPAPEELDNVLVRVVRPGEDAAQVLEQARAELAAQGGRRRRGARGTSNGSSSRSALVEITPLDTNDFGGADLDQNPNQDLNQDPNQDEFQLELDSEPELFTIAPLLTSEVEEEAPAAELDPADEGRRRRRRSSAS
ncbi:MAG: ribonuclease E, partial [Synechococcaceae bacterium WB8_1B_057]|nr:ribonuclease E [Synechococcaceae bacterium WB8_1B_057]